MNRTWATKTLRQMKSRPNVPFLVTTLVVLITLACFIMVFIKLVEK